MKEQNLDFEVARDFFIEMKYYDMLDFVIPDIDLALNSIAYDHEITQHMHYVRFEKSVYY